MSKHPTMHCTNATSIFAADRVLCTIFKRLRWIHTSFNGHLPGKPELASCHVIPLLHLFLKCASFWNRPKLSMSFLTQSHQVFFGQPLFLNPSNSHVKKVSKNLVTLRWLILQCFDIIGWVADKKTVACSKILHQHSPLLWPLGAQSNL